MYLNLSGVQAHSHSRAAFGKVKFQQEIPKQRAHMHSRRKLWYFYLSRSSEGTRSVSTFPASDLMWLEPRVGFPCSWGADGARLCNLRCEDKDPMPWLAAPRGTELVWERRTHRNRHANIKCSPKIQNPGFTEVTGKLSLNSACSECPSGSSEIALALRKTL